MIEKYGEVRIAKDEAFLATRLGRKSVSNDTAEAYKKKGKNNSTEIRGFEEESLLQVFSSSATQG